MQGIAERNVRTKFEDNRSTISTFVEQKYVYIIINKILIMRSKRVLGSRIDAHFMVSRSYNSDNLNS